MSAPITTEQVWAELEKQVFAVVGMVTRRQEARTVGIMYTAHDRRLLFVTGRDTWKARHMESNPHVSVTVPIAKRVPLMPWLKIPAATITFQGIATVGPVRDAPAGVISALLRGMDVTSEAATDLCLIEIAPEGEFVTYGVGVPLMTMRDPEQARGRAPVGA